MKTIFLPYGNIITFKMLHKIRHIYITCKTYLLFVLENNFLTYQNNDPIFIESCYLSLYQFPWQHNFDFIS